jgi:PPK2 family polyphosphate:nucleotide phosphotransferase
MNTEIYRARLGQKVDLSAWPTRDRRLAEEGKEAAKAQFAILNEKLERLQELLYAESKQKLLIVLQAMDTGGKDSTIRHVFHGTNPQGVRIASFKKPTAEELAQDYLWRVHKQTPARGQITIFNRSHYEDVLVVRVHDLVPKSVWSKRYDQINAFEKRLAEEGTTILKFFLHISKDEQRERLQSRVDQPHKRWKFAKGDLDERKFWGDYQKAYETVLEKTSTDWAPWYIVPGDSKWYRNLVISDLLVKRLESLDMSWPQPEGGLDGIVIE